MGEERAEDREGRRKTRGTKGVYVSGCSEGSYGVGATRENHHQGLAGGAEDSRNV